MSTDKTRDCFAAVLFLAFGLLAVLVFIPQGVPVPASVKSVALSPNFWPRIVAYTVIAASLLLLLETLALKPPAPDDGGDEQSGGLEYTPPVIVLRTLVLLAMLLGFYLSLTVLGVVAASVILILALMLYFGERRYALVAALSFATPVLLYLFFRYVAGVPIPVGVFGS